jgi:hypothetical protein
MSGHAFRGTYEDVGLCIGANGRLATSERVVGVQVQSMTAAIGTVMVYVHPPRRPNSLRTVVTWGVVRLEDADVVVRLEGGGPKDVWKFPPPVFKTQLRSMLRLARGGRAKEVLLAVTEAHARRENAVRFALSCACGAHTGRPFPSDLFSVVWEMVTDAFLRSQLCPSLSHRRMTWGAT